MWEKTLCVYVSVYVCVYMYDYGNSKLFMCVGV